MQSDQSEESLGGDWRSREMLTSKRWRYVTLSVFLMSVYLAFFVYLIIGLSLNEKMSLLEKVVVGGSFAGILVYFAWLLVRYYKRLSEQDRAP